VKLIYVAGRYRGLTAWEVEQNVRRAEELGLEVAKLGAGPVIPHSMNRFFYGTLPEKFWLAVVMALLERCDAVVMVPGWESSMGSQAECRRAEEMGKRVFGTVGDLKKWLEASSSERPNVTGPTCRSPLGSVDEDWMRAFVADMRAIGLLAEVCLGCGKVDCGGCPCGTSTSVIRSKLSSEASSALNVRWHGVNARNSYRCVFCGKSAEKDRWGPGRINCPNCGELQPSPGELDAVKAVCSVCAKYWRDCACESGETIRLPIRVTLL
jgi:hypothetical protein